MSNLPDIWIDTTTIFRSVGKGGVRPTGIPRVVLECVREALNDTGVRGRIRLCRVSPGTGTIVEVPVSEFDR